MFHYILIRKQTSTSTADAVCIWNQKTMSQLLIRTSSMNARNWCQFVRLRYLFCLFFFLSFFLAQPFDSCLFFFWLSSNSKYNVLFTPLISFTKWPTFLLLNGINTMQTGVCVRGVSDRHLFLCDTFHASFQQFLLFFFWLCNVSSTLVVWINGC